MKKLSLILTITSLFFMSCDSDKDPIVDPEPTEAPADYSFLRNGATTVFYSGQSTRIAMGQEFVSALKDETKTELQLDAMFNHQAGGTDFSDASLNASSKNIRSKLLHQQIYFRQTQQTLQL